MTQFEINKIVLFIVIGYWLLPFDLMPGLPLDDIIVAVVGAITNKAITA